MYNGNVGGVSGGNGNIQWSRTLADNLDAADGKKDGKISANNWNVFLTKMGSSGNRISNYISVENAVRSLNYYESKKDAGKADWNNWAAKYEEAKSDFKEGGIKDASASGKSASVKGKTTENSSAFTPKVGGKNPLHKGYTITAVNNDGTFYEKADNDPTRSNLCNADGTVIRSYVTDSKGNIVKCTDYKKGKPYSTSKFDKNGKQISCRFHQSRQTASTKTLANGVKIQVSQYDNGDRRYRKYNPETRKYDIPCDEKGNAI